MNWQPRHEEEHPSHRLNSHLEGHFWNKDRLYNENTHKEQEAMIYRSKFFDGFSGPEFDADPEGTVERACAIINRSIKMDVLGHE